MMELFFLLEIWLQNEMSPLEYLSLIKKKIEHISPNIAPFRLAYV